MSDTENNHGGGDPPSPTRIGKRGRPPGQPESESGSLAGRDDELRFLTRALEEAAEGSGAAVLLSGEAGIGKTRIVEELCRMAGAKGVKVLKGAALADTNRPFLIFSDLLEGEVAQPLFEEHEYKSFAKLFAVDRAGTLVADAAPDEDMDTDIFAGMLSAVQDFVRDSFDSAGETGAGLGRLEYGDMKILIENGRYLFLTAVFEGGEHEDMKGMLKRTVQKIEEENRQVLESWSGRMDEVAPVQAAVTGLAEARFRVRRDLEGVKLEGERLRIADKTLDCIRDAADGRPLLVVLEDVHWADESSLFVLGYVARNIAGESIAVVGTMRPEEDGPVRDALDGMRGEGLLTELVVGKLGSRAVSSLASELYPGNAFPPDFIGKLADQCEGNPFFIREMLIRMGEEGNIMLDNETYVLTGEDYSIPGSVQDVVHSRLERLDPDSMTVAEYVSCVGGDFTVDLIKSYSHIRDPAAGMGRLREQGIIEPVNGSMRFGHAIYRDLIYEGIGPRWKSAYHKSLGEYFESAYDDPEEVLYELARHFSRSGEHVKALDYCTRAGGKAEGAYAPEQAIGFYKEALKAAPKIRTDTLAIRLDLLERLGNLHVLVGDFDEAIASLEKALEGHTEAGAKARMLRKIADACEKRSEYDRSVEAAERGLAVVPEGSGEHGRLLTAAGLALSRKGENDAAMERYAEARVVLEKCGGAERELGHLLRAVGGIDWSMGRFRESLEHFEKSLDFMERAGDEAGIASALHNIGMVYTITLEAEKGLDYYRRSLEITDRLGDVYGSAYTLYNMGYSHVLMDHWEEGRDFFERSIEMKRRIGDVRGTLDAIVGLGQIYQHWGQMDRALEYHSQALAERERIGNKFMIEVSMAFVGECHMSMGELDRAIELFNGAVELSLETGNESRLATVRNTLCKAYLLKGEPDRALEQLDLSQRFFEENPNDYELISVYMHRAEVHLAKGDVEAAGEMLDKAAPLSKVPVTENYVTLTEGRIMAARGEWQAAFERFERVTRYYEGIDARESLASVLFEHGKALASKGEASAAAMKLRVAVETFTELNLVKRADEVWIALESL